MSSNLEQLVLLRIRERQHPSTVPVLHLLQHSFPPSHPVNAMPSAHSGTQEHLLDALIALLADTCTPQAQRR